MMMDWKALVRFPVRSLDVFSLT